MMVSTRKVPLSNELRDLLRMLKVTTWGKYRLVPSLADYASCTEKRATDVIKMARRQGYIECSGVPAMWRITEKGRVQ